MSEPSAPAPSGARTDAARTPAAADRPPRQHRISRAGWIGICAAAAVVLLLVGATLGLALGGGDSAPATPGTDSVDAGFARDMIVHHDQGVLMAHYGEENTTDDEIAVLAYDIGYTQTAQLGQMQGWLALWDLPEFSPAPHMAWMAGADGHGGHDSTSGSVLGVVGVGCVRVGCIRVGCARARAHARHGDQRGAREAARAFRASNPTSTSCS